MNPVPQLLVGGRWENPPGRLPVTNPFTGETLCDVPLGDTATIESALAAAHAAFPTVRDLPGHRRAEILERVVAGIEQRRTEFADTIVAESGKPITFAEAEVTRAIMTFRAAADEARRPHGELLGLDGWPTGAGHFGLVRRFPLGVISAITPFNFPLNLVAHKVAPCLATGNTTVLKPALKTPLTALLLAEVLAAAEIPAGQINVITCPDADASALVTDDRVKYITFTGSQTVGWMLKERSGKRRITLELGGNAGCIIHSDADITAAVPLVATGAFGQAGQSCISVQRVYVHESLYDRFRDALVAWAKDRIQTGDPRDRATVVGPMITRQALEKVTARIAEAQAAGGRVIHGGNVIGQCLEATILEDVPESALLCADEAFAPIVTLHRYHDFDEALARVNDSRFGLQAGIFTRDLQLAMKAFHTLEVGGVLINQVPTFRVETMPYGGVKESGLGREGLRYAMEEMTEPRSMIVRLG